MTHDIASISTCINFIILYAEFPKEFNETYRFCIAHTEKEIDTIICTGVVFYVDKTGFLRPENLQILYSMRKKRLNRYILC